MLGGSERLGLLLQEIVRPASALGDGRALVAGLGAGFFENFARSRKIAPNAHFLKEL